MGFRNLEEIIKTSKTVVHKERYAYLKAGKRPAGNHFLVSRDNDSGRKKEYFDRNYYFSGRQPIFSGKYKNYADYEEKHPYDCFIRFFSYAKGKRILDVGGATGAFLSHVPASYDKTCLDISMYSTEMGRRLHPGIKFFNCDITEFDYHYKFDIITAFDVLEHVKNVKGTLNKIYDLLDENGVFIFTVPIATKIHHLLAAFGISLLTCDVSHITLTTEKAWKDYIFEDMWEIVHDRKLTIYNHYIPPFHIFHLFIMKKRPEIKS
jgi:2-polyprenyl-3-methyl-5-hydroxy-6-metoxy-1,4-benzoquinol methylase